MDDEDGDGGGVRAEERERVVDLVVIGGERRERGHAGSFCLLTSAL